MKYMYFALCLVLEIVFVGVISREKSVCCGRISSMISTSSKGGNCLQEVNCLLNKKHLNYSKNNNNLLKNVKKNQLAFQIQMFVGQTFQRYVGNNCNPNLT